MNAGVFQTAPVQTVKVGKFSLLSLLHWVVTVAAFVLFFAVLLVPALRQMFAWLVGEDLYANPIAVSIFWLGLFAYGKNSLTVWWALSENSWFASFVVAAILIGSGFVLVMPVIIRIGEYFFGNLPGQVIPLLILGVLAIVAGALALYFGRKNRKK